jgi:hypothetical protein
MVVRKVCLASLCPYYFGGRIAMSMTMTPKAQEVLWFVLCMVCLLLVAFPAFSVWAPWTGVITVADAAARYPGQIDPKWRAVSVNHGRPSEWRFGTIAQNPLGFAAWSAVLAVGVAGFFYSTHRFRQIQQRACRGVGA